MKTSRASTCRGVLCALAVPLLAACSMTIRSVVPTPNTAFVAQQRSLELAFAPEVADRLDLQLGNLSLDIQSWRTTLANGFRNGFRSAFPAKRGPSPDLTLRIDKAQLEVGDFDHTRTRIQYAATLTGAGGTARRTAGIASRGSPVREGNAGFDEVVAGDVSASVAAMYEQIARDLFAGPPSGPRAAGCVPGQSIACVGQQGCQGFS